MTKSKSFRVIGIYEHTLLSRKNISVTETFVNISKRFVNKSGFPSFQLEMLTGTPPEVGLLN